MGTLTNWKTSPVLLLETYSKLVEKMPEKGPVEKYLFKVIKKKIERSPL